MGVKEPFDIVLVGDVVADDLSRQIVFDWDNPTWPEVEQLAQWLRWRGRSVQVVPSVSTFAAAAGDYREKLIFPLWRGGGSRNRTCIVPGVCEALGLPYVGADSFAQGVCQDKSLSKHYLRAAGIECMPDVVVSTWPPPPAELNAIHDFPFPVVVKPLFSACSIGIDADSLCLEPESVPSLVCRLTKQGLGPVMIEPFIKGTEVSICLVEAAGEIVLSCVSSYVRSDGSCPFADGLFTMDQKTAVKRDWKVGCRHDVFDGELRAKIEKLIALLGPFGPLRVDGRLSNGRFIAIELTPDIHLGLDSAFIGGFDAANVPPESVLDIILTATVTNSLRALSHTGMQCQIPFSEESIHPVSMP